MNWTTEKPTRPGWYAWRMGGEIHPYLAKVFNEKGKLVAHLDALSGRSYGHIVSNMVEREWFYVGPL